MMRYLYGGGIILYDLFLCSKRLRSTIVMTFWGLLKFETHLYNLVYSLYPYNPCTVYLPTLGWFFMVNVGKYTIHGWYGIVSIMMFVWDVCWEHALISIEYVSFRWQIPLVIKKWRKPPALSTDFGGSCKKVVAKNHRIGKCLFRLHTRYSPCLRLGFIESLQPITRTRIILRVLKTQILFANLFTIKLGGVIIPQFEDGLYFIQIGWQKKHQLLGCPWYLVPKLVPQYK